MMLNARAESLRERTDMANVCAVRAMKEQVQQLLISNLGDFPHESAGNAVFGAVITWLMQNYVKSVKDVYRCRHCGCLFAEE